jgi:hypothetical protein
VDGVCAGHLDHLEHLDLSCNVLGPQGTLALAPLIAHTYGGEDGGEASDGEEDMAGGGGGDGGGGSRPGRGLYSLNLVGRCRLTL